ncbi:MAG: hypothetical protein ACJAT5_000306 [Lentimonas sp.]|jgi:hypothetical protein
MVVKESLPDKQNFKFSHFSRQNKNGVIIKYIEAARFYD